MEAPSFGVDLQWIKDQDSKSPNEEERRKSISSSSTRKRNLTHKKNKKLCALCDQKFPTTTMGTKVTRKRIIEWRRSHGIAMKNASPFTLYDYVPVCLFCAQFFGDVAAERPRRERSEEATNSNLLRPMIFANEDRVMAYPPNYFSPLFR